MQLKSIKIRNFKSILSLDLNFADNLYCLVGENEIGKSNILQAISLLGDSAIKQNIEVAKFDSLLSRAYIEGTYELSKTDISQLRSITSSLNLPNIGYNVSSLKSLTMVLRKKHDHMNTFAFTNVDNARIDIMAVKEAPIKTKILNKIAELLPIVEYYEKEEFLLTPMNIDKYLSDLTNPNYQSFIKLFSLGGENDLKKLNSLHHDEIIQAREIVTQNLNELLSKYYKSKYGLQIKIESHDGTFTLLFKDQYNNLNLFTERSTGFQYFFSFLINKLYIMELGRSNSIYLFDEPALSLHPTSQKKFIKLLEDLAQNSLVLYTTHSPFSINRMKPTRVWVIERDSERGTFLNPKPYQNNWRSVRTSLGIDIADSFFYAEKTLLVEGPEDKIYISILLSYFADKGSISLNSDLFSIIDSGSISNMPAMIQILLDEKRPMYVLIDNDSVKIQNRLKLKEKQVNNKYNLSINTIADIDSDAVSIEDILPMDLYIEAVKNFINYLITEQTIKLKNEEIEPSFVSISNSKRYHSIAEEIVKFYQTFDDDELDIKVPISKVGIAHEFEKLIKTASQFGSKQDESKCLKLINLIIKNLNLN